MKTKLDLKKFAGSLALTNSLIISITFTVIIAFKSLLIGPHSWPNYNYSPNVYLL